MFLGQEPTSEEQTFSSEQQGMAQQEGETKGQATPLNDNDADEEIIQSTPQPVRPNYRRKLTK